MIKKHALALLILFTLPAFSQNNPLPALLERVKKEKDSTQINTLFEIVSIYGNMGLFDSSEFYSHRAFSLSQQINFSEGLSMSYNSFGISYMVKGDYKNALKEWYKGLEIAEKTGHIQSAMMLNRNISNIYIYNEEFSLAIPILEKIYAYKNQIKDTLKAYPVAVDIGFCFHKLNQKDSAKFYYSLGIQLDKSIQVSSLNFARANEYLQAKSSSIPKISKFYIDNNNPQFALELLLPLWHQVDKNENIYNKVAVLVPIVEGYLNTKKYDSTIYYANAAFKADIHNENIDAIAPIHDCASQAYAATGNYKEAYEHQKSYVVLKDSIFNNDKFRAIKDMQTKYDTEKKEQQILSLNQEKKNQRIITGISIAALLATLTLLVFLFRSKKLQKRLFEKEKLLQKNESEKQLANLEQTALRAQMNPHFIFNSLNSVQRFVINNDSEGVNTYLTTFASLIRQTLENSGKKLIALKDELKYLEAYLKLEQMRANNSFGYSINVSPEIDVAETFIPSMIIQPFVENSINHGMANKTPGQGDIKLIFSKNGKLNCIVQDNGTGIKQSVANTDPCSHEPMGSTITQKRIFAYNTLEDEKIELSVTDLSETDKNNNGTVVTIKFPLKTTPQ